MQARIAESKKELEEARELVRKSGAELDSLNAQYELKKKEVQIVRHELEFIEKELASVGKKDDTKKIVEAAGAVTAAINAKYEAARKELDIVKAALARTREEYESAKAEIGGLKRRLEDEEAEGQG